MFTPAPWIYDEHIHNDCESIECIPIYGPNGEGTGRVAQAYAECGREDELRGNAQLIAAVHDLLELAHQIILEARENKEAILPLDIVANAKRLYLKATGGT